MMNLSITYNHCIDFPEILVQQKQVTVFNIFIEYRPFKNVFWKSNNCDCSLLLLQDIATFHTKGPGNESICLVGQQNLATIFVMKI